MKKYFVPLTAMLSVLLSLTACREEQPFTLPEEARPLRLASVPVTLSSSDDDTKSLISVDVENFVCAYLFAFDATTKEIMTYHNGTEPIATAVSSNTFNWTLPIGQPMDLWALVNPPSSLKERLNQMLSDTALKEADLKDGNLLFQCPGSEMLLSLESSGDGMPMSGRREQVEISAESDPLSIPVQYLFARYDIYFNTSEFSSTGWTVRSTLIQGAQTNTEVPFFCDSGYKQTDISKLAVVDCATDEDLAILNEADDANNTQTATFYFLENCQGNLGPATSWRNVRRELGDKVACCSYLDIAVRATKPGYGERAFKYRVYLGKTDMCSNFDVERNFHKVIKLNLTAPTDGFLWTTTESITLTPSSSFTLPFETSLESSQLSFSFYRDGVESSDVSLVDCQVNSSNASLVTAYPFDGSATFQLSAEAPGGSIDICAHSADGDISDVIRILVFNPDEVVLEFLDPEESSVYIGEDTYAEFVTNLLELGQEIHTRIVDDSGNSSLYVVSRDYAGEIKKVRLKANTGGVSENSIAYLEISCDNFPDVRIRKAFKLLPVRLQLRVTPQLIPKEGGTLTVEVFNPSRYPNWQLTCDNNIDSCLFNPDSAKTGYESKTFTYTFGAVAAGTPEAEATLRLKDLRNPSKPGDEVKIVRESGIPKITRNVYYALKSTIVDGNTCFYAEASEAIPANVVVEDYWCNSYLISANQTRSQAVRPSQWYGGTSASVQAGRVYEQSSRKSVYSATVGNAYYEYQLFTTASGEWRNSYYKLVLYTDVSYDPSWIFDLIVPRTYTGYYAFTLSTNSDGDSTMPIYTYDGKSGTINTPDGKVPIEQVVKHIRLYSAESGHCYYLTPVSTRNTGMKTFIHDPTERTTYGDFLTFHSNNRSSSYTSTDGEIDFSEINIIGVELQDAYANEYKIVGTIAETAEKYYD